MIDDPFSRFDDVPITEEEVNRIKKTVGSLYRIKADTSVLGDHPKPLVAYFQGEPVYKGDLVVLLEYSGIPTNADILIGFSNIFLNDSL